MHIKGERGGDEASPGAAQQAWQRWAAVSRKARTVLKRASPEVVAVMELSFLHFLEEVCSRLLPPVRALPLALSLELGQLLISPRFASRSTDDMSTGVVIMFEVLLLL